MASVAKLRNLDKYRSVVTCKLSHKNLTVVIILTSVPDENASSLWLGSSSNAAVFKSKAAGGNMSNMIHYFNCSIVTHYLYKMHAKAHVLINRHSKDVCHDYWRSRAATNACEVPETFTLALSYEPRGRCTRQNQHVIFDRYRIVKSSQKKPKQNKSRLI